MYINKTSAIRSVMLAAVLSSLTIIVMTPFASLAAALLGAGYLPDNTPTWLAIRLAAFGGPTLFLSGSIVIMAARIAVERNLARGRLPVNAATARSEWLAYVVVAPGALGGIAIAYGTGNTMTASGAPLPAAILTGHFIGMVATYIPIGYMSREYARTVAR
ncbi:MAG TPA: hypothetical protein ENK01_04540 [Hellea balneolensis]|uniref:Uncharacterized protein n=1 Tax=Hellea balneolensis TaxID=287478 RepID=A0A7V5U1J6_9PROT|nr:hypothetical protein [Hellea balneolensis]